MKIIVEKSTNLVKYLFDDGVAIEMKEDSIITPDFIIADLNTTNATLIEDINESSVPSDWIGNKYIYTETDGWQENPDWVEPIDQPE